MDGVDMGAIVPEHVRVIGGARVEVSVDERTLGGGVRGLHRGHDALHGVVGGGPLDARGDEGGGPALTGPNLYGVFGRQAGAVADYAYSPAVKAAGFVWDGEHLDKWLADPRGFLPGTKMSFAGLKDPKDRIDLIAYLKVETGFKPAP